MVDVLAITYGLGALGLLVGVGITLQLVSDGGWGGDGQFGWLLVIPGFAALMYALMALDVGTATFQGYRIPIPRYVDWLVTTPVLVGYAAYVSGLSKRWIVGMGLADAVMIAVGGVAVATAPPLQWVAFAGSAVCHLGLLVALYAVAPRTVREQPAKRERLARILRNHVGLLWIAYPVIWVLGPGTQIISSLALSLIITYLDVIAKTPYVYFVYRARDSFGAATDRPVSSVGTGGTAAASAD